MSEWGDGQGGTGSNVAGTVWGNWNHSEKTLWGVIGVRLWPREDTTVIPKQKLAGELKWEVGEHGL